MKVGLFVAGATVGLLSAVAPAQRRAPIPNGLERAVRPEAGLVSIRLTHAAGFPLGMDVAPRVESSTSFEGDVTNLPLGANVWLAARTRGGSRDSMSWQILTPPATAPESGRWSAHVDLPCAADNDRLTCEVIVFVALQGMERRHVDEEWIHDRSYAMTQPARVQVLSSTLQAPSSITISTVGDASVDARQPVPTASSFGVEGTSRDLNGRDVWIIGTCAPDARWKIAGHTVIGDDGRWRVAELMLPAPIAGGARTCAIGAASAPGPAPAEWMTEEVLTRWLAVRSMSVNVLRSPYYLSLGLLSDADGGPLPHRPDDQLRTSIQVTRNLRSAEVETDPLPPDVHVWQLLRCAGCSMWLAFGPAQPLDSGRHLIANPQTRYPARPSLTRFEMMAMASRVNLEGRALSDGDLESVSLGASRPVTIVHARTAARTQATVTLDAASDSGAAASQLQVRAGILDVACRAVDLPEHHMVYVGYREPASTFWTFHRATRTGAEHRVSIPLSVAVDGADESASLVVPVITDSLPVGRRLQNEWWAEMIIAAGQPAPFHLPIRPSYVRALRWVLNPMRAPVSASQEAFTSPSPEADPQEVHVNMQTLARWVTPIAAVVAAAALMISLWRRRTAARVVVNAWLDARHGGIPDDGHFLSVLKALAEQRILRAEAKMSRCLAKTREQLNIIERELDSFYEPEYQRLQAITGRHDASTPLPPTVQNALLALLTVGESAFNLAVFYVFREPAVYTLLMALAVAVSIPICAFSVGLWIRRWRTASLITSVKLTTTVACLGVALVGLNRVRMAHLGSIAPNFAREHPELGTAFLSFNALIFLAAAMLTYWGHDVEENFAESKRKVERLRRRAAGHRGQIAAIEQALRKRVDVERQLACYYEALYRTVFERHVTRRARLFPG